MSEKRDIFTALHRTEIGAAPFDFRALLCSIASSVLSLPKLEAEAFAQANLRKYWNWLGQEIDNHKWRGLVPFFSPVGAGVHAITSPCHSMATSADPDERLRGEFARSRPLMLRNVDTLTHRQYEALACVACSAIGSARTFLTPPGNEGGIDFFATLSLQTSTHVLSASGTEFRIIGQCKKYASPVAVDKMEQFITTIQNVRHRSPRVVAHIPAWFDDSRGPIIGWMMSHTGFQSGTADEAKNHGIVLSDTLDIVELLSLSPRFHSSLAPSDRAKKIAIECQLHL